MNPFSSRFFLNASWLLKLRWVAAFGQLLTVIGTVVLFNIQIPMLWAVVILISLTVLSNSFLTYWLSRINRGTIYHPDSWNLILGLILVMDMLSLTTLLFATGGPNNPFSLFFFVNLSLCATMLSRPWAWSINGVTIVCFAGLLYVHHPMEPLDLGLIPIRDSGIVSLQQTGSLIAFATCASVIVYFMTRLTGELRKQQQQIRQAQIQQANSEKIEALGTLAAGAAHELATPLSTIAVVAKDVEQAIEDHPPEFPGAEELVEDVHLIRSQLDRCRKILDRMASHAGETVGESIETVTIGRLCQTILDGLLSRERVQLRLSEVHGSETIAVPVDGLSQAMRGLVQNGLDANPAQQSIEMEIKKVAQAWQWEIVDRGKGMTETELNRVSEPFYTTKPPGAGMGLGVFLAKNVIQRLGGSLQFDSQVGQGTRVTVRLPLTG